MAEHSKFLHTAVDEISDYMGRENIPDNFHGNKLLEDARGKCLIDMDAINVFLQENARLGTKERRWTDRAKFAFADEVKAHNGKLRDDRDMLFHALIVLQM